MATLKMPVIVEEIELDPNPDHTEDAPLFYGIPYTGVRYYTYDYRPALKRRLSHWEVDIEEDSTGQK